MMLETDSTRKIDHKNCRSMTCHYTMQYSSHSWTGVRIARATRDQAWAWEGIGISLF
jgi:hypothetical protein